MHIRFKSDLLTALLFLAFGFAALIYGQRYDIGSVSRMGAGFFPTMVSVALIGIGLILLAQSIKMPEEEVGRIDPRAVILVLAGTLAFGLLIERAGLVIAATVLVLAARLADPGFRIIETLVLSACLILITGGIFWWGLGLPLRLWPA